MKAIVTALTAVVIALAGCASERAQDVSERIDEKRFSISPSVATVEIGPLKGQLSELSVVQRVNAQTGAVVSAPQLRGTLSLENTSEDQALRVIAGHIGYLDEAGTKIALAEGRGAAEIRIYGYSGDRLDPGGTATHQLDVPFPAAALQGARLAELRLGLTYIPVPYRDEAGRVAVSVTPQS